ncbi:MAG: cytosine deaminase [Beijerinckiaceae bacterium]
MGSLLIRNARVPRCLLFSEDVDQPLPGDSGSVDGDDFALLNIATTASGMISGFMPVRTSLETLLDGETPDAVIDADRGIVLPAFVECHTHLDKGHIWPRTPNPDGTFPGALESVGRDREARWTAADVRARMDFALRSAEHHGVAAIRTHLDSIGKQIRISWPVFAELRDQWRDRILLQGVPLFAIHSALDPNHVRDVVAAVRTHGSGVLGAVTYMCPELEPGLDIMFRTAMEHGFDLDFHVDESSDPAARSLERIALAALRHGFKGNILCGHCCSLALQGPEDEKRVIGLVKEAGIAIVSLPMCNMYLQDRQPPKDGKPGRTPRWRGVTLLHELKAAGVPVMVSSDNTRDPFYAYGDLDTLEVFREATRIGHLDHPAGSWISAVTSAPARAMGLNTDIGRLSGGLANLVLFKARNWTELLSRPQTDRIVIRNGRRIETSLPDYRELDGLEGMRP